MAKLRCESNSGEARTIELRLGVNRLGRSAENDFQIVDPSVSGTHCEIVLECGQITAQDCGSTNGTFLDGNLIKKSPLQAGQVLRLGGVDLVVLDTEIPISIPTIQPPVLPAPPMVLPNGAAACQCRCKTRRASAAAIAGSSCAAIASPDCDGEEASSSACARAAAARSSQSGLRAGKRGRCSNACAKQRNYGSSEISSQRWPEPRMDLITNCPPTPSIPRAGQSSSMHPVTRWAIRFS